MTDLWKLSPSELTFLWDECKRCFYLKVVHQFNRPWAPFPRIFGQIDGLMNDFYREKLSSEISPDLPEGVIEYGEKWVESQPIALPGYRSQCFIRGRFDSVIAFTDGSYGVIDFKTTKPSPKHVPFYSRQLHAYAYALEHPASGKLRLSPVTRLGLLCVEPVDIDWAEGERIAYLGEVTWMEIPKDEAWFLEFLDEVMAVLDKPEPPSPRKCGYCHYRRKARSSGW